MSTALAIAGVTAVLRDLLNDGLVNRNISGVLGSSVTVTVLAPDRVVPGGMIVLDDYEWSSIYREQKRAEDRWFQQRGHRVFPLPTGQGFVIKR